MLLSEAKRILKTNGYKIIETYNAVSDHTNAKEKRTGNYSTLSVNFERRLVNALKEAGVNAKIKSDGWDDEIIVKNSKGIVLGISCHNSQEEYEKMNDDDTKYGVEVPDEEANYSYMLNNIKLDIVDIENYGDELASKKFDIRNTPSMVKWIIKEIEDCE